MSLNNMLSFKIAGKSSSSSGRISGLSYSARKYVDVSKCSIISVVISICAASDSLSHPYSSILSVSFNIFVLGMVGFSFIMM